MAYGLRIRGMPRIERAARVNEMLEMMQISHLAKRRIDQLSGGQKQRVALARALAARPRALLLDEPLTALDAKLRDELRVEIKGLLRQLGITAIYVTHDQSEAMSLGDRVIVMSEGEVAQVGTPHEVYFKPQSAFVAHFIGTMNRLPARAENGRLVTVAGNMPYAGEALGEVDILFRPIQARLAANGDGSLKGDVRSCLFLGERTRIYLDLGPGDSVALDVHQPLDFPAGTRLGLDIDLDSCLIVPQASFGGTPGKSAAY